VLLLAQARLSKGEFEEARRLAEPLAAQAGEARVREQAALLDKAQDAILVRDLEDRIRFWNKSAERLYGWTAREALGRSADELLYGGRTPELEEAHRVFMAEGEWRGEMHQRTKWGRAVVVESRWTLVRDERGLPLSKFVVNTDISEKKRMEAELVRAAQLSLLGELAAGLAHEIKNPLAGIQGAVDILIRRRDEGDPERDALENVRREVGRIDATVRTLLERARPRTLNVAPTQLGEVVRQAVSVARDQAAAMRSRRERVAVEYEPPVQEIVLPADAAQIEDAVLNLLLNAIEALGPEGGRVSIKLSERRGEEAAADRGEAVVEVEDTGRGMSEEELRKIFNPFYTTSPQGTGLGLPAVQRIARAHGGRVEVSSTPGRGSIFTLRLPLAGR
jgi:PAS domain S-box-containing protein